MEKQPYGLRVGLFEGSSRLVAAGRDLAEISGLPRGISFYPTGNWMKGRLA